ncbi:MAG: hypothetical protein Q9212_005089 [Teloschistes hypoglaucus]
MSRTKKPVTKEDMVKGRCGRSSRKAERRRGVERRRREAERRREVEHRREVERRREVEFQRESERRREVEHRREVERRREADMYDQIGDLYLDGPWKSARTPEEEEKFHQHLAELRALPAKAFYTSTELVKDEQPETRAATESDGRVMIQSHTGPPSLQGHGGQASSQPLHPDRQSPISSAEKYPISGRDPYTYVTKPVTVSPAHNTPGSNWGAVTFKIQKPRVAIESTPRVECATSKVSGRLENSLSTRLRHGPDSMTSRLDEAVAQRNLALATQRVKLEPSRWGDRMKAADQSSRGPPGFQAATKPSYIDKYRPAEELRTKPAVDSYRPSDSTCTGPSAREPHASGSSGTNAKRARFEMEDHPKDTRSSSSEPSKKPKLVGSTGLNTIESRPVYQMETLAEVEAALRALNGKFKHLQNTYPSKDVVDEVEGLGRRRKLARLRRDELDEKNKKAKEAKQLSCRSLAGSSALSNIVPPKEFKRSNHDIATETMKPNYALNVRSSGDNAELSGRVGQLATTTQKNAGGGTAYPGKSTGLPNAPGLAHAPVGNAEQLMKTTTDVRRKFLGVENATPKTFPRSTIDYETAAAIDSLIASEKAAAQSLCAYPRIEHQSSKRRRVTAAELNDEVYPCYPRDWDDEDVEMSLP